MNISVSPPRRVSDPGAPALRVDAALALGVATAVALGVTTQVGGSWGDVSVLGAALVASELLVVPLADGSSLPLSGALLLPLAAAGSAPVVAAAVALAVLLSGSAARPRSLRHVVGTAAERVAAALAAWVAFRVVSAVLPARQGASLLVALAAAAGAVLAVELAGRRARRLGSFAAASGPAAFFAMAASGLLMAVGHAGVDGRGVLGLWAVPIFAVPALSARWAFGRLHAIRRTYDQTIDVLSVVPEMAGQVRPAHARRVATLSVECGRMLGLSGQTVSDLERAALLHALGSVTLEFDDQPAPRGPREVAGATVGVLADEDRLSRPAGLVAGMAGELVDLSAEARLAAEVLRVAAVYESVAGGDPVRARLAYEVVASDPEGDRRVVAALARVLTHRGLVGARG